VGFTLPTLRIRPRRRGYCASRAVALRSADQLDHLAAVIELEREVRDRPDAVPLDRLDKDDAGCFRAGRREIQRRPAGCAIDGDLAERRAGRDRAAEHALRDRARLKLGDGHLVGFGVFQDLEHAEKDSAAQQQRAEPDSDTRNRPPALHALEMLDAVPAAVAPGPGAALGAQHENHDQAHDRNKREQRDVGLVADAPDPVEQERAPVPAVDFRGDGLPVEKRGCVAHEGVTTGHSRSKNGVASLAYAPVVHAGATLVWIA